MPSATRRVSKALTDGMAAMRGGQRELIGLQRNTAESLRAEDLANRVLWKELPSKGVVAEPWRPAKEAEGLSDPFRVKERGKGTGVEPPRPGKQAEDLSNPFRVKEPGEGVRAEPPRPVIQVETGLGPDVDALASLSPTLSGMIHRLRAKGWTVKRYSPRTDTPDLTNSKIDLSAKTVSVAVHTIPTHTAGDLALAVGHAHWRLGNDLTPLLIPRPGEPKEAWMAEGLRHALRPYGEAAYTNAKVADEITLAGGPDIKVVGGLDTRSWYEGVARGHTSRDWLVDHLGSLLGRTPGSGPGRSRQDDLLAEIEQAWRNHHGNDGL